MAELRPFERVYIAVKRIPTGRVATYGQVAEEAEVATPRVVSFALSALDEGADVPWHRVLGAGGRIRLGSRDGAGDEQRSRLRAEGIRFDARGVVALDRYQADWSDSRDAAS